MFLVDWRSDGEERLDEVVRYVVVEVYLRFWWFLSAWHVCLCLASDCDDDGIVAHVGQDVTLRCGYNISTNGEIPVCWGRDAQYILGCRNELLATDGSRVKEERRASCRYQMLGHLNKGDVSLTIRNVTEEDSGLYACRVEIPGIFNDELYYMDLSVVPQTSTSQTGSRMSVTKHWKTAGVLVRPKGITKYSKCSNRGLNAVFHSSPSLMKTK
uniref:Ig-like domain-containing protein n=1 Tax=Oryzias latipes TaxID=8090 RepID=A0A3P9M6C3_ORYLA